LDDAMTHTPPTASVFTAEEWAAFGRQDRRAAVGVFSTAVTVFLLGIVIYSIVFFACV
jgi:hypothetical protein